MIILTIFACAFAEVEVSTGLFGSFDIVVELPLVESVRCKLWIDALVFAIDKDCLATVLAGSRCCSGRRSGVRIGAAGRVGRSLAVVLEHTREIHMPTFLPV